MATHKEDQPLRNEIADLCEQARDNLALQREALEKDYWAFHKRLSEETFRTIEAQLEAMDRLGRLAAALKALREAEGKFSAGRCW